MSRRRAVALAMLLSALAGPGSAVGQVESAVAPAHAPGIWHVVRLGTEDGSGSDAAAALLSAELELALDRPERVRRILAANPGLAEADPARFRRLEAALAYAAGQFERAGELWRQAADVDSSAPGALYARAGEAFERAGLTERAAGHYRRAAELVPLVAPWLGLREARVSGDTAAASPLLEAVPTQLRRDALEVWGDLLVAAADTVRAVSAYVGAARFGHAARLSLQLGDSLEARRLAYEALADADTGSIRRALDVLRVVAQTYTADEAMLVARAHRSLGDKRSALRYAERALRADSVPATALIAAGDLLAEHRQRQRAATLYARAAEGDGAEAATAAYKRARLLRRTAPATGARALEAFANRYPEDRRASLAMYLAADRARATRRVRRADSLDRAVVTRWPKSTHASRTRFRLASHSLTRGDTAAALAFYREESAVRGTQRRAADYFIAALHAARGDSLEARGMFATLARQDSLGYYGMLARVAAGLPPMTIEPAAPVEPSPRVLEILAHLDFFRAAGLDHEEDVLVASLVADRPGSAKEWLDIAEGLIDRGRTAEGVRLGWQAARVFTLNHPRVLRVIFPWPLREAIEAEAEKFGLDPYLLVGLIRQESAFRAEVVSHAGAHGLMQLMPMTARGVARQLGVEWNRALLRIADANLHLGVSHFAGLLKRYDGEVIPALAAYNAGSTPVRRWLRFPEARDPVLFVERVPYAETRGYLRTVLRNRALYRALHPPREVLTDGSR